MSVTTKMVMVYICDNDHCDTTWESGPGEGYKLVNGRRPRFKTYVVPGMKHKVDLDFCSIACLKQWEQDNPQAREG